MKRILSVMMILILMCTFAACGEKTDVKEEASAEDTETAQTEAEDTEESEKVLVVYFSATGTTKSVAEKIAKVTDADLYEIKPADPYTEDDLNWHDDSSRTSLEQNDPSVRPEIKGNGIDPGDYDVIYVGYPIWWGEEPRIMDTFAESYDFGDTVMIPFCTSSSSGIGKSGRNLEDAAGSGNWKDGKRFGAGATEDEVRSWIESL